MVSRAQARRLALGLPETTEQDHHGRPSFRVAGKIFATLWDADHMNVLLDEDGILTAVQSAPEACEPFWWGKRLRAVSVNLHRVRPSVLADLLADAWETKAPRRLSTAGHDLRGQELA
ncbi:MAG: MmcQ/YjbR family DNA-binding protein [Solirubrobacteraceae bacterium]